MAQIAFSELPEYLQHLLSQVQQTGEPLSVTQDGIPLAIVYPATKPKRVSFGVAKGSGEILGDIVESSLSPSTWEVLQ